MRTQTSGDHSAASFVDLMASLMVIFILLFVAFVNNATVRQKSARASILDELRTRLTAHGRLHAEDIRQDEHDPYAIVIITPSDLLFERNIAQVTQAGQAYLSQVMPVLANVICSPELGPLVESVVVEGHTDSTVPQLDASWTVSRGRDYNMELSQRRSMDVVRWSLKALEVSESLPCFRGKLSASGRGQEELRPDLPGDDVGQRRVILRIRVRADSAPRIADTLPVASAAITSASP